MTNTQQNYFFRIPPTVLFFLLGLSILIISSTVVIHVTSQPWIGVAFDASNKSKTGILIKKITPHSPASDSLLVGQRVISIESTSIPSNKVTLTPSLLDFPLNFPKISEYNNYIDQHIKISKILHENKISLILDNNERISLEPENSRPLNSIPWIYYLLLFTNFIGLFVGIVVLVRNPAKGTGKLLLLMGFSYYMMVMPSIFMLKEIAILSSDLPIIPIIENFFSSLLGVCLMALLMTYPNRLYPNYTMWVIAFIIFLFWLNATFQWTDLPFHSFHLQYIFMYPIVMFFSYKQWISTKEDPIKRAACSAFLLPVFIFAVTTVSLFIFPLIFIGKPLLSTEFAKFLLGSTFIGFAVSMLQYRLFDVEKWWFKTWLWIFSGLLIILMDLVLVYLLHLKQITALGIAVLTVGFVYFPFRQWLLQRLLPQSEKSLQDYIPTFMKTVSQNINSHGFENSWKQVIQERYSPINIEYSNKASSVQLINNGLMMLIPDMLNGGHYQLTGKNKGLRLFDGKDSEDISSLHSLMSLIDQTSQKHHSLRMQERCEIMQDMHDTVGSSLLTLSHIIKDRPEVEHVHNTLQTLRDTIHLSTSETPLYLSDVLADCRIEAVERCELVEVELQWQETTLPERYVLSVSKNITLINIFREAISNALCHATPSKISVLLCYEHKTLLILIGNNGTILDYKEWKPGNGLANMKSRAIKSGGTFTLGASENKVEIRVELPLEDLTTTQYS